MRFVAGRGFSRRQAMLLEQALEPPREHLAHHAEIVARREPFGADVELAVLVFGKAFRAGDDHGADRVRAHDMRIVVDLDAARRTLKAKYLRDGG